MRSARLRRWILLAALAFTIHLTLASRRLVAMSENWFYYDYPYRQGSSPITFGELVRYSMWLPPFEFYSTTTCVNELRLVDGAKQQWALEKGKSPEDTPSWEDLKPYIGRGDGGWRPCCTAGGCLV